MVRLARNFYALMYGDHLWAGSISTNRQAAWKCGAKYCKDPQNYKAELRQSGWRCAKLAIFEVIAKKGQE